MPPDPIRRPLTITAWLLMCSAGLCAAPVLYAVAALIQAAMGSRKPLIAVRVVTVYCAYELATLLACGALWLLAGAGRELTSRRFLALHWRLLRWYVAGIAGHARAALEITVARDDDAAATRALVEDGPLLAFSRHAGPADTLLFADEILSRFERRPSAVFKQALLGDPCIDILGHRLPHAVIDPDDREASEARIAAVTAQLDRRGVLLLFPEGANFTPERRRGAIEKLRRRGRRREAAAAEAMPRVLPPHPTGVQTALHANPAADVIFAAHTGLGLAAFPLELWREMPIGGTLRMRAWRVPAAEVPRDPDAQSEWLYGWWRRIDEWVAEQS